MDSVIFIQDEVLPALLPGVWMSIQLIVPSATLGLIGGILVGSVRVYGPRWLAWLTDGYVMLFRGTPLVVQLMIWYFGLPHVGIRLTPYQASVGGFILISAAYHSEYIRGALMSIRRGQILAAQALGFTRLQTIRSVILPQALRRALPGCGNEIVYLIKYSSLAYIVTCLELTGQAKKIASYSFRFSEVFLTVGVFYLLMVSVVTYLLHRLEERISLPGFGWNAGQGGA